MDAGIERRVAAALAAADLQRAVTEALRGYGPQVLGYMRTVLEPDEAEDAFSQFCEFLWKEMPRFRAESTFLTWAYRLSLGAVRSVRESPYRRRRQRLSTSAMDRLAEEVRSSTAVHLKTQTAEELSRIRGRLDLDERTLLVLRIDRDLPWSEVAAIMEVDEPALRKRFERLKTKVKKLMLEARRAGGSGGA